MRVNMNKTQVMISGECQKVRQKAVRWPCGVCSKGVGSNLLRCNNCQKWVHNGYVHACVRACVPVFTCISTELWHFVIILPYYVLSSFTEIRGDRPYLVEVSTCAAVFLCF